MSINILIAEDEKKLAGLIAEKLQSEGYNVDTVHDGNKALQRAYKFPYDLVVLDIMLPLYSGTEILRELRRLPDRVNFNTPVLMLTARDGEDDKVKHFEIGADDYLTKPFSFAELAVRVKALLKRSSVNQNPIHRIGDLELDRLTRQVKRGGKRITLTAKEYALLEFMVLNADKVVSRDLIVEKIWDQSFENVTNIVDVYIRQLRQKIDEDFPVKLIRTVHGLGYAIGEHSP
jgi:DNA-binding response OmpR family regulator